MIVVRTAVIGISILIAGAAFAQDAANKYDGNWSGTCGVPVDLEIHGQTGTWTPHANRGVTKNYPCTALKKPVEVVSSTAESLSIQIDGSKAMQSCPDVKVTFAATDATHIESKRSLGSSGNGCALAKH